MTTLGALLVGLLLLLVLLGVFAWLQRRPRRGPEQPRTVADLVRMREAGRPHDDDAAPAPSEPAGSRDDEPEPVGAEPEAVGGPAEVVESPVAREASPAKAHRDEPVAAAPVVVSAPEDVTVDMPWTRAARMVEPWRDAAEPDAPPADAAPTDDQPRPSLTLLSSDKVEARSRRASYWAVRTKPSHHPSTPAAAPGTQAAASDPGESQTTPTPRLDSAAAPATPAAVVGPAASRSASVEVASPLADDVPTAAAESVDSPAEPVDQAASAVGSAVPAVPVEVVDSTAAPAESVAPSADAVGSAAVPVAPVEVVDSPAAPVESGVPSAGAAGAAAVPDDVPAAPAEVVDSLAAPAESGVLSADAAGAAAVLDDVPAAPVESVAPSADAVGSAAVPVVPAEVVDSPAAPAESVAPSIDAAGSAAVPVVPAEVVDSLAAPAASGVPSADAAVPAAVPAAPVESVAPSADAAGLAAAPVAPAEVVDSPAAPAESVAPSADAAGSAAVPVASAAEFSAPPEPSADPTAPADPRPEPLARTSSHTETPAAVVNPSPTVAPLAALPTNGHGPLPTPARVAGRVRRRPSATPAEQAAADLALLRTFGVPSRNGTTGEPEVELEGCTPEDDEPVAGAAQPIAFRVLARDGHGIHGATVTLLDDHGRETAGTRTRSDGNGVLTARHPGGYMLVAAADGYQPGAITVAVTDAPVDAEIPLTRSASVAGTVGGEDGPIVGAQLALVQDGEIVDTTKSAPDGAYRFADLAAGEYGLSVTAYDCEAAAFVLTLADEVDLRQDVELVPAGLPADDVMTAPR